jgi:hypothetical protein
VRRAAIPFGSGREAGAGDVADVEHDHARVVVPEVGAVTGDQGVVRRAGGIGVDDRLVLQMPPGRAVPDAVIEIRSAASPFGRDRIRLISLTLVDLGAMQCECRKITLNRGTALFA